MSLTGPPEEACQRGRPPEPHRLLGAWARRAWPGRGWHWVERGCAGDWQGVEGSRVSLAGDEVGLGVGGFVL